MQRIHHSPCKIAMAFSGIDNEMISDLISGPGSENSILEAVLLSKRQNLKHWQKHQTERQLSPETALANAEMAFRRVEQLQETSSDFSIGLGCLAELSLERPLCFLATQTNSHTRLYTLRSTENIAFESHVNTLLLKAILDAGDLGSFDMSSLHEVTLTIDEEQADPELQNVWNNRSHIVWSLADGSLKLHIDEHPKGILSGSFNPLHEGHRVLRNVAEAWLKGPVYFEMPITNAEKLPLDYLTIKARRQQFDTHPLALTNAPAFVQKMECFRNVCFVVGADTAERIVQPRFYGGDPDKMRLALETIRGAGGRFLVAGREQGDDFLTLSNILIPNGYADLFEELPESAFRLDLSSTEKRKKRRQ